MSLLFLAFAFASEPLVATPPVDEGSERGAVASTLHIDSKLAAEVLVDGVKLAQLYGPARLDLTVAPGDHLLRVYTHGQPHDLPLRLPEGEEVTVVVGRSGLSSAAVVGASAPVSGVVPVEFRVVGGAPAMLRFSDARHTIANGDRLTLDLPVGSHDVSIRSGDGTVIWAVGRLTVGGGEMVVQLAEGRVPEVSGGGSFDANGG